jgi:hypothetical protein
MRKAVVDYSPSGQLEQAIGKVTIIPGSQPAESIDGSADFKG